MSRDSKKILFVGILITIIIGFLIIWILVEDHKSPNRSENPNTHASNIEHAGIQLTELKFFLNVNTKIA